MQPLDAGIIAWVKTKYNSRLLFRVFENLNVGKKFIYNVDILTALRWICEAWDSFPVDVIKNISNHCLMQTGNTNTDTKTRINAEALQSMERNVTEDDVTFTQAGLDKPCEACR